MYGSDPTALCVVHAVATKNFAGVERYITYVAPELARRGVHVVVLGGDDRLMRDALGASGVEHHSAPGLPATVRALLRQRRADVVHVHMTSAEIAGAVTKLVLRSALVTTRHFAARRGSTSWAKIAGRVVGHAVDLQISVSQYVADTVEGPSRTLLTGVPNRDVGPHKARTVLVAQRMEAEKDGTVAIEAWNRSKLAERGWRLLFAGAGGDRRRLEDAVERYHLVNSVSFLGFVDGVDGLMANSSMLLATAPTEPYGITVAEAMACGLPVVAAAGGGHLETVGAVTPQTMFPPGDASAAAELLRQLAGNDRLRQGLGEQLVRYQRAELSLGRHVDQLMMLYRSLTPGSGANSAAAD